MAKAKNIIDKIKEENVRQKPKWYFRTLRFIVWGSYIICILAGAATFSIILFAGQQADFHLWAHLGHSSIELVLGLLPIFWMVTLLLILLMSVFVFRRVPRGYKHRRRNLLSYSAILSIILGSIFFFTGGGHQLEKAFADRVSSYDSVESQKIKTWMQPKNGFLAGRILQVKTDTLLLNDFNGKTWQVPYKDAFIADSAVLKPDSKIKLIGTTTVRQLFTAKEIRPWLGQYFSQGKYKTD